MPDSDIERIVLGTAALGLPYGLPAVAGGERTLVTEGGAAEVLDAAWSAGVRTLDAAPAYGVAEERVGGWQHAHAASVWTKTPASPASADDVLASLDRSLQRLRRDRIDLYQWHNWTPALATTPAFAETWKRLETDDRVTALGATTYGASDARAAVESGLFDVVQVEWNLLNQGVLDALGALPKERGVRIAVRTVLLQGILAGRPLPSYVAQLAEPRARLEALARDLDITLPALAVRAALDHPGIDHVLVGADSPEQIGPVVEATRAPGLTSATLETCRSVDHTGSPLVDPLYWLERERTAAADRS